MCLFAPVGITSRTRFKPPLLTDESPPHTWETRTWSHLLRSPEPWPLQFVSPREPARGIGMVQNA